MLETDEMSAEFSEHLEGCADCQLMQKKYASMTSELATLAGKYSRPDDEDVLDRADAALREESDAKQPAPRKRDWRRFFAVAFPLAVAAAVIAFFVFRMDAQSPNTPAVSLSFSVKGHADQVVRGDPQTANRGDILTVRASAPNAAHAELRLYLEGRESTLLQCPADSACRTENGMTVAELALSAPGVYRTLWLFSPNPLPPATGLLDNDVGAATKSGADFEVGRLEVW